MSDWVFEDITATAIVSVKKPAPKQRKLSALSLAF